MKTKTLTLHLVRWNELPEFPLYIDQVTSIIEDNLRPIDDNNYILTKAMINNYVKHGVIGSPVKKKYTREHVASLMMTVLLKQVYTLDEIMSLVQMQLENKPLGEAYDCFCNAFEEGLAGKKSKTKQDLYEQVVTTIVEKIKIQQLIREYQEKNSQKDS